MQEGVAIAGFKLKIGAVTGRQFIHSWLMGPMTTPPWLTSAYTGPHL
jgi:hypothetical protein